MECGAVLCLVTLLLASGGSLAWPDFRRILWQHLTNKKG